MNKPKITYSELIVKYPNLLDEGTYIVGIRGYYKATKGDPKSNDVGIFDDAIIIVSDGVLWAFNGNTDPSKSGKDLAMLRTGEYLYAKGKHRNTYDALKPYPFGVKMPCTRDGKESTAIGCNIHAGGEYTTGSQGCQTLPKSQWTDFITNVYSLMEKKQLKTIKYFLYENC